MIGIGIISGIMMVTAFLTAAFYVNERRVIATIAKTVSSLGFMLIAFIALSKNIDALDSVNDLADLKYGMMMLTGLTLCLVGDIFLMIKELFTDRTANLYLLLGVGSFAIAQILFAIRFIMYADRFVYWLLPIILIAPAILLVSHKANIIKLEKTAAGLVAYSVIIGFTTVCALNLVIVNPSDRSVTLLVALVAFMLSDTALCYTYYGRSVTLRRVLNYVVMILYYIATILLAYSILL